MKTLHPVNWAIEKTAEGTVYAYAWGGGLADPVRTDTHATEDAALADLRIALRKLHRCPDPKLCNEHTEAGRKLLAVLSA